MRQHGKLSLNFPLKVITWKVSTCILQRETRRTRLLLTLICNCKPVFTPQSNDSFHSFPTCKLHPSPPTLGFSESGTLLAHRNVPGHTHGCSISLSPCTFHEHATPRGFAPSFSALCTSALLRGTRCCAGRVCGSLGPCFTEYSPCRAPSCGDVRWDALRFREAAGWVSLCPPRGSREQLLLWPRNSGEN